MNRTILIIVVIGVVVAALIFAFNQTGTDTDGIQPEVTEVVPPQPDTTENLNAPNTDAPTGGVEAPADGTAGAPQQ